MGATSRQVGVRDEYDLILVQPGELLREKETQGT